MIIMALLFGENPQAVAYLAQPLCWSGWETSSPTTHRGTVRKDRTEIPRGWSMPVSYVIILIIQWRRQRHLTWPTTHDVVSREINLWKSYDLLRGSNPWALAPSIGCLTARPPELTNDYNIIIRYNTRKVMVTGRLTTRSTYDRSRS